MRGRHAVAGAGGSAGHGAASGGLRRGPRTRLSVPVTRKRGEGQPASGPADRGRSGDGGRAVPLAIAAAIAILTLAVYARVAGYPFVAYDDDLYVTQNPHVLAGLSAEGAAWAFTTTSAANWHPLTWLSHMADVSLFGVNPGAHHAVNVVIHAANALLLFFLLSRTTGAPWRSGFVAALFSLHPLHVESVAWVAERKDVLSALFFLLACRAHVRYVERPGRGRYLALAAFFCLGLLSKPTVVTLPFVLLLLDYWPLGRMAPGKGPADRLPVPLGRLLLEKVPLFLLAAAVSAVAYATQQAGGTVSGFPWAIRAAHAVNACAGYIGKMFWPGSLAVFYPFSGGNLSGPATAAAVALLASATALALATLRSRPYLAAGWFWYLVTLVPASGIVQVGAHSMADRYTYLPLVGIFVMLAWGVPPLLPDRPGRKAALAASAALVLSSAAVASWFQVGYWRDSEALFSRALNVTADNWVAHYNLALVLQRQGRDAEAAPHYLAMLRIVPELPDTAPNLARAHNNLGVALERLGDLEGASTQFRESLRLRPRDPTVEANLGNVLRRKAAGNVP